MKTLRLLTAALLLICSGSISVQAQNVPSNIVYEGRLLDASRRPVTSPVVLRFSLWKSADWSSADENAGSIETSSANYGGWFEAQDVTPDAAGIVSLQLGRSVSLPAMDFSIVKFLQVEVKAQGQPDSAYQLLDPTADAGADADDRKYIGSVPYAFNSDRLQGRQIGTGSGSVPLLQSGGLLPSSAVPNGTSEDVFTVDEDDSATGTVTLQFGSTLAKQLSYDVAAQRFSFNDDLYVQGDLTVTGLINGLDLSSLGNSSETYLKVSSGAGLTVSVGGGSYRLNGSMTNFGGTSNFAVSDNTTNYVFFGSGGLTANTTGFPTDVSFIPVAEVVTAGGAVQTMSDRRVLSSDDREKPYVLDLHPNYPNASFKADGADNVGQLSVTNDGATGSNHYRWTSTRTTLQDYDVLLRVTLPETFVRWDDAPLALTYRTLTTDIAHNRLDITVFDTAGSPVTLAGQSDSLVSGTWATTQLTFSGTPVWTPGGEILVKIRLSANELGWADAADLHLGMVTLGQ